MQYGFLIENGKSGNDLRYLTKSCGHEAWTGNHLEAMRFGRKEDAERYNYGRLGTNVVVQHIWENEPMTTFDWSTLAVSGPAAGKLSIGASSTLDAVGINHVTGTFASAPPAKPRVPVPSVMPACVDAAIAKDAYYVFPGTQLTVCCLKLHNGFTVTGESTCADPAGFDAELGRDIAYNAAKDKVWMLLTYKLREDLFKDGCKVVA